MKNIGLVLSMLVLGVGILQPAEAQIVIRNARLELVELSQHFRDEGTRIQAARGDDFGLIDFEVEFEDDTDIVEVSLQTPRDLYRDLDRDGRVYRALEYVGDISNRFRETFTIIVGLQSGGTTEFDFTVEIIELSDFPEIEFPPDGADELDSDDLEADWRSSGDSNRIDLFEIDATNSNDPPDMRDLLETWRTISEDLDLENALFRNRRYELWIGETEIVTLEANFDIEFWDTSSRYLRFTTGPDPREDIDGFNAGEFVTSATAGFERKRFGQTSPARVDRVLARLVGGAIEKAEIARVKGPMDVLLQGPLQTMEEIVVDTVHQTEIGAAAGQDLLFLMEFRITALVGSEIAKVDSSLSFPQIVAPLSNESGLGSTIQVNWKEVGGAEAYLVSLIETGGSFAESSDLLGPGPLAYTFEGVPANLDFILEVEAKSVEGSVSSTSVLVSTRPQGDADGDGSATAADALGFAERWMGRVPTEADFPSPSGSFRLDLDGDEILGPVDLLTFLELAKVN